MPVSLSPARSLLLISYLVCVYANPSVAAAGGERQFSIPAQSLSDALISLAVQANISISLGDIKLNNGFSPAYEGYGSVEQVLAFLLRGTGFRFRSVDASTFRVERMPLPERRFAPVPVEAPAELEQIIVTSNKRAETLQSAPYSVATVDGAVFPDFGIASMSDMAPFVAGLARTNQGPGRNKYFIRGLSDGAFASRTQSVVGLYLDETRITFNAPDPDIQLVDVDRVEIVRGPQGTLYGAGALGGLVRIITNAPKLGVFEARAAIDGGLAFDGSPSGALETMVNLPLLNGAAAVRGVGYFKREGGYINDVTTGRRNVNKSNTTGFRLGALGMVDDSWMISTGVIFQSIASRDTQYYDGSLGQNSRAGLNPEPHDNDFFELHLKLQGQFSWGEFTSTTAWVSHTTDSRFDASLGLPALIGVPVQSAAFNEHATYRTIDHESRLTSPKTGDVEWLMGVFFSRRTEARNASLSLTHASPNFSPYLEHRADTGYEYAIFGEGTYYFYEHWFVTGGLRLYRGTLESTSVTSGFATDTSSPVIGRNSRNGFTPKVVVGFKPDDSKLIYGEISQGFRMGGIDTGNPIATPQTGDDDEIIRTVKNFESDSLWNFELGAKSDWLDQKLTVNITAYYDYWSHIQSDQVRSNGLSFAANVGTVKNIGVEADSFLKLSDYLDISANVTWNHPTFLPSSSAVANNETEFLPAVPKLSAGFGVQYRYPVANNFDGFVSMNYFYVGPTNLSFDDQQTLKSDGFHLVNARVGMRKQHWRASLYIENIADSEANTFAFGNPFSLRQIRQVTPPRPRTIGLNLRRDF